MGRNAISSTSASSHSQSPSRWKTWKTLAASSSSSPLQSPYSTAQEGELDSLNTSQLGRPRTARILDSFRRDPEAYVLRPGSIGSIATPTPAPPNDGWSYDMEAAARATANSPLLRKLKGRHLQMIAIGGSIGSGLFVGSGRALETGGPASLLIAFALIGLLIYCTVQALGELAVMFPIAGSFAAYSTRFVDPAWGFAMGWNYCLQWLVVLPLEILSASITIDYWQPDLKLNTAWVAIFLVVICSINLFGVKGYAEAEYVFSMVKVISVIGYIILGAIINIGGGPGGSYIGFKYWHNPGAFHNGFKGLCSSFVTASFAFAGTELVGLAAAETENPRKTLPSAVKQVFWRITLFYIVSLLIVGTLVPWNDKRLLSGSSSVDAKASPFVISIQSAGIKVLPDVMNVIIMISVLSVGNSAIYGSSRTLAALAEQQQAPRVFAYIDRKGRPLVALAVASSLGLLAFMASTRSQTDVFNWLLSLSGLSSVFTWASICLAHIRFRQAWAFHGHSKSEITFLSSVGTSGSWIGLVMNVLVLLAQFWTGFAPVGYQDMTARALVSNFFQAFLAAPIVLVFYLGHKLWYWEQLWNFLPGHPRPRRVVRSSIAEGDTPEGTDASDLAATAGLHVGPERSTWKWIPIHDMDLQTGRRELNMKELLEEERWERREMKRWKKIYKFLC